MTIKEILETGTNLNLTISATDLREFAEFLLTEAQAVATATKKADKELTLREAAQALNVSLSTLWRWQRDKVLTPCGHVGRRPVYLESQINALKGKEA